MMSTAVREAKQEVRGVWRELQRRGEESRPIVKPRKIGASNTYSENVGNYGGSGSPQENAETDYFDTGFTLREIGPQAVRLWLGLQVVSVIVQLSLWNDVSTHLSNFDAVLARECAPTSQKHGICMGPMWSLAQWKDEVLSVPSGTMHQNTLTYNFRTKSNPPTFLITVDPVSMTQAIGHQVSVNDPIDYGPDEPEVFSARWTFEVIRTKPPQVGSTFKVRHMGQQALTFEDMSEEARQVLAESGSIEWRATLTTTTPRKRVRFVTFVEDAATPHLKEVHASPQCTFTGSWKAFNQQHQGHSHKVLAWCQYLLAIFVIAGGVMVFLVDRALQSGLCLGYKFHLLVFAKFFIQDVPQQICIVLFILGWYEASGLRCQMCLFNPGHCSEESVFGLVNSIAIACSLLSSISNQLLIRQISKKEYTEDDICIRYCVRIGGACVATLPFTTGLCAASKSVLPMPGFIHALAAFPCGLGWLGVVGFVTIPLIMCCDDEWDDF